jgi:hypothetical protein
MRNLIIAASMAIPLLATAASAATIAPEPSALEMCTPDAPGDWNGCSNDATMVNGERQRHKSESDVHSDRGHHGTNAAGSHSGGHGGGGHR